MPAVILTPQAGWKIVDGCAAPGNKTTHVAALLLQANDSDRKQSSNQSHSNSKKRKLADISSSRQFQVFACELDQKRAELLRNTVAKAGLSDFVSVSEGSFLSVADPSQSPFDSIDAILLDPTCSGSGMVTSKFEHALASLRQKPSLYAFSQRTMLNSARSTNNKPEKKSFKQEKKPKPGSLEALLQQQLGKKKKSQQQSVSNQVEEKESEPSPQQTSESKEDTEEYQVAMDADKSKILALAAIQKQLLQHAMSFPKCQKIVYSTCSIHEVCSLSFHQLVLRSFGCFHGNLSCPFAYQEEDEAVVADCLKFSEEKKLGWRLETALPNWPRRGKEGFLSAELSQCVVRVDPEVDLMNGFFVASFSRTLDTVSSSSLPDNSNPEATGSNKRRKRS
jgi:putative methyltransferase